MSEIVNPNEAELDIDYDHFRAQDEAFEKPKFNYVC